VIGSLVLERTDETTHPASVDPSRGVAYPTFAMKSTFSYLLALTALAITPVFAGPVPITPSQLGVQNISNLTPNPSGGGICDVIPGCGGAFTATIGPLSNVTLWCVDSQEFDQPSYTANIVSLNTTPDTAFDDGTQVRYGSVGNGGGSWLYSVSGVSNSNDALTRYKLAAILITMYNPQQEPVDNPNNDAVQQAIWQVMENTSIAPGQSGTNGEPNLGSANSLIGTAESILASGYTFSGWAVASGAYVPGSPLGTLSDSTRIQTYLVEVTPEPRFYGILLVGLLSLCGMIYRRRVAS
jgi:hypothetical protein